MVAPLLPPLPSSITCSVCADWEAPAVGCFVFFCIAPNHRMIILIDFQFYNAIYVVNADSANPSNIYIYDATAGSWSTQKTTLGQFDPSNFAAILDHDTNVFYAYSKAELYSLNMGSLKTAQSSSIPWVDVQSPDLSAHSSNQATQTPGANTAGYQPVMALAKNHIHFLGVPGEDKGTLKIFVIHCMVIHFDQFLAS